MCTVVNSKATPSINFVNYLDRIVLQRSIRGRQAFVVTSSTIDKIPRSGRIIKTFWISDPIVDRRQSFIEVFVTKKSNIDTILQQNWLKSRLARVALRIVNIPRAMAGNYDPRCLLAVDGSKVFLQPLELRAVRREGTSILRSASTRKVWGIRKLSNQQDDLEVHAPGFRLTSVSVLN